MKMIAFVMLFVSSALFAGYSGSPKTPQPLVVVDAATNNIPAAYDTTAGSQLYTFLPSPTAFDLCNLTASPIAVKVDVSVLDCNGATGDNYYVPADVCLSKVNIAIGKSICIRGFSGAIAAGTVTMSVD